MKMEIMLIIFVRACMLWNQETKTRMYVCIDYENSMPLQFYNTCTQMEWMKKESFVGFENKL